MSGPDARPLYRFITCPATGIPGDFEWNFEKFLIGRDGRVLRRHPPPPKPQDSYKTSRMRYEARRG